MKHIQWTTEQQEGWDRWVDSRPECVQEMCASHPPDNLYRLTTTDQIVTLASYSEDGTVRVDVDEEHNPGILMERQVFGIDINDLVLWEGDPITH